MHLALRPDRPARMSVRSKGGRRLVGRLAEKAHRSADPAFRPGVRRDLPTHWQAWLGIPLVVVPILSSSILSWDFTYTITYCFYYCFNISYYLVSIIGTRLAKRVSALSGTRLGRLPEIRFPPGKRIWEGVLLFCTPVLRIF